MAEDRDRGVPSRGTTHGARRDRDAPQFRARVPLTAPPTSRRWSSDARRPGHAPVYLQSRGRTRRTSGGFGALAAGTAALAAAALAVWFLVVPMPVSVNGASVSVPARATVGDLLAAGVVAPQPGVLHALDGSVIATAAGPAGLVVVNGKPAAASARVRRGDRLTTVRGAESTEPVRARQVEVAFRTVEQGFGGETRVKAEGANGLALELYGAVSGLVIGRQRLIDPVNRIVERTGGTKGASDEKLVALTFDDGPWSPNDQTVRILDILDEYQIKATFFMLGNRVKVDETTAAEVADRGHLLGNHSFSHPILTRESDESIRKQVRRTNALIEDATGVKPRWFRAPGGAVNDDVRAIVEGEGMLVAHWTIGTGDWKNLGTDRVVDVVTRKVSPGAVVLMHDGGGERDQTIEALPRIIESLRDKGYRFVTLDELPSVPGAGEGY